VRPVQLLELVLLAALWGGSFLFMRIATPEFGPVGVSELRVLIAAAALALIFTANAGLRDYRAGILPLCIVGLLNAVLPFSLFAFATLHLTAGFTSILNATAPFFSAIVAYVWLRERLTAFQIAGLMVGFTGVIVLLWGKISFGGGPVALAVAACLLATLSYGIAASYIRKRLLQASPMAITTGSQIAAALCLLPPALWLHPAELPSPQAWLAVAALGLLSTGLAFLLYYRLVTGAGTVRAMSVTFLIPVFGMLWGALFLEETVTSGMLAGTVIILAGTALTTGIWPRPPAHHPQIT
jgi:drug/metabolite transporter (DMT)-like permease